MLCFCVRWGLVPRSALWRRGLSEVVVLLALVVVAIAIGFLIKQWATVQVSRMPSLPVASGEAEAVWTGSMWIVTVKVTNHLDRWLAVDMYLDKPRLVYRDGSIKQVYDCTYNPSCSYDPALIYMTYGGLIYPKSEGVLVIRTRTASGNPPIKAVVNLIDSTTGANTQLSIDIAATM
jgi:hypothetical protein